MSSSAAEVLSGKIKVDECETKPAITAEEPVVEKEGAGESGELEEPTLPPLTAQQFREFNRMADHMDYFVSLGLRLPHKISYLAGCD